VGNGIECVVDISAEMDSAAVMRELCGFTTKWPAFVKAARVNPYRICNAYILHRPLILKYFNND